MTGTSLKELARLSKGLNEASDALSEQIAQVEEALNELRLGVHAYVKIRSNTSSGSATTGHTTITETQYLGYGKCRGKWCLLYVDSTHEYPDRDSETPLRDAARTERIEAVDKLPDLIRALEQRTRELANEASTKATQVAAFAAALRQ